MQLVLRILAGPNAGGELLLGDGDCVIGAGDSCDVVLADSALSGRHLMLTVAGGEARASSLDGSVFLLGEPFENGVLDYYSPLCIGSTHLAVGPAGSAWPQIALVVPTALAGSTSSDTGPSAGAEGDAPGTTESGEEFSSDRQAAELKEQEAQVVARDKKAFAYGGVGVVVLALILLFLVRTYSPEPTSLAIADAKVSESAAELVKKMGFKEIQVQAKNGKATLKGYVPTRKDRRALVREVRTADFPVKLRVRDGESLAESLRESLAMAGLKLGVTYAGNGRLDVQGYAADRDTVKIALETALQDVPGVSGVELNLLTARDAVRELAANARKQGLGRRVAITAYPGYIQAKGRLSDAQLEAWTRAKKPVMQRYGGYVDLRENFSGVRRAPKSAGSSSLVAQSLRRVGIELNLPEPAGGEPARAAAPAPVLTSDSPIVASSVPVGRSSGPRIAVQSVSLGAARFMTLKNGKRYFEGGRLPGGYVIREIMADRIVLAKGSSTVTHRIGGM